MELCGTILPDREIRDCKNLSTEPNRTFQFQLEDLEGQLASWHSHPTGYNANLSIEDYGFFVSWPELLHFIVASDEVRCYTVEKGIVYLVDEEKDYPVRASA